MAKVQQTYTQEFKREAVRLAQTSGKPITQVARELGISDTSIQKFRKDLTEHGKARLSRQRTSNDKGARRCANSSGNWKE
jgi:transposase-like protein